MGERLPHQRITNTIPPSSMLSGQACAETAPPREGDGVLRHILGCWIGLRKDRIPNLASISERRPRRCWNATPVSELLSAAAFFEMLAARKFPTTTWLRSRDSLDYIPEPDIFTDVFGHVPHAFDLVFAGFLQHYGSVCARLRTNWSLNVWGGWVDGRIWHHVVRRQDQGVRSGVISHRRERTVLGRLHSEAV